MAKGSFRIEGLTELVDGMLNELPKATSANVVKRALMKAAAPMESDAKQNAPVKTGKLKEKIDIGTKLSKSARKKHPKEMKYEVYVGPPSMSRAIVAEYGSVKQSPKPFMRPAWDANKKSALKDIVSVLSEELEKARQRIARKTARQLAKIK